MQNDQKKMINENVPLNIEAPLVDEAPPAPAPPAAGGVHLRLALAGVSTYAVAATALLANNYFSSSGGGPAVVSQDAEEESKAVLQLGGAFWITPPMSRTGCSNWEALLLNGRDTQTATSGDCGKLCNDDDQCEMFNYQPNECAGTEQNGGGSCFLFKGGCAMEVNDCWDLYFMRRGEEDVCRDSETMMSTDPSQPGMTDKTMEDLGPLRGLLGKWSNDPTGAWRFGDPAPKVKGLNVVRLPLFEAAGVPGNAAQTADFEQLNQTYVEEIEFQPIMGAVRNRGYTNANHFDPACQLDQFVLGIHYLQKITDINTGAVLHDESGQWLWNEDPGVDNGWSVARLAVIPHGQAVEAIGLNSTIVGSQSIADDIAATMTDQGNGIQFITEPLNTNLPPGTGYAAVFPPFDGVESLIDEVPAAVDVVATKLSITTSPTRGPPGGSIGQLPNPKAQAFTQEFNFTFWIEEFTEVDATGTTVKKTQLQYLQNMFLVFMASLGNTPCQSPYPGLDCLIKWPHYEMNTLFKVEDYPFTSSVHDTIFPGQKLPPIR